MENPTLPIYCPTDKTVFQKFISSVVPNQAFHTGALIIIFISFAPHIKSDYACLNIVTLHSYYT